MSDTVTVEDKVSSAIAQAEKALASAIAKRIEGVGRLAEANAHLQEAGGDPPRVQTIIVQTGSVIHYSLAENGRSVWNSVLLDLSRLIERGLTCPRCKSSFQLVPSPSPPARRAPARFLPS